MTPDTPCPDRGQLVALSRGELDADAIEALCGHLSACPGCQAALAAIEESSDDPVARLRRLLGRRPLVRREEYEQLEARAKSIALGGPATARGHRPAPPSVPLPRVDAYQLLRELGRGDTGVVYAALNTRLNRPAALKVIEPDRAGGLRTLERLRLVTESLGGLDHPNIVAATEVAEADGRPFVVMELVDGLDLDNLLRAHGPLPVAEACAIARQAAGGLEYVYARGQVHRDLKPSHLMLAADGLVKVLDLGMACLFDQEADGALTATPRTTGTADYRAPEQWVGGGPVDIRADIYSLGCTLFKLLTGKTAFGDFANGRPVLKQVAHMREQPPPVRLYRPDVPAELDTIIARALAKAPADRFATPQAFADALAPFAVGAECRALLAEALERSSPAATEPEPLASPARDSAPGEALSTATDAPATARAPGGRRVLVRGLGVALAALALTGMAVKFSCHPAPTQPVPAVSPSTGRSP